MESSHDRAIAERATSSFGISIGTALALEALFPSRSERYDDSKDRPSPFFATPDKPWHLLINVQTMYRNLLGTLSPDVVKIIDPEKLAEVLALEMQIIQSLCKNEGHDWVSPYFYWADHKAWVGNVSRIVKFRESNSPIAELHARKLKDVKTILAREEVPPHTVKNRRDFPQGQHALILSHFPIELSAYKTYRELLLVESHTGKIKDRKQWGSKYYKVGDFDMGRLPYTKKLLYMFGDSSHIHPQDLKVRKMLIDTAEKGKWTPLTTEEKVIFDIDRFVLDPALTSLMKGFS